MRSNPVKEKRKVLFVATVDEHIRHFHLPYIQWFSEQGYQVDVAAQGDEQFLFVTQKFDLPFNRDPFAISNRRAAVMLKRIVAENNYELVHFHTPVASFFGRVAIRRLNCKILYTAHGFHFFKGASLFRWLCIYPLERLAAHWTDGLITINEEDYSIAKKFTLRKGGRIYKTYGIGVDMDRFSGKRDAEQIGRVFDECGIPADGYKVLSVGELISRKNHEIILRTLARLQDKNIYYLIAGRGLLLDSLEALARELGVMDRVRFLGYRNDVSVLYQNCDLFVFPSKQEGLPVALAEAMFAGMPCIASDVRGNRDLIANGENGLLCMVDDTYAYAQNIQALKNDRTLGRRMGARAQETIEPYTLKNVLEEMRKIYGCFVGE